MGWKRMTGARKKKNEHGLMIAVAALGMTMFLSAAGMAADISNFYTASTELQSAADAAALAGATTLNSNTTGLDVAVVRQSTSNDPTNPNYYSYTHYKAGTNATAPTERMGVYGRRVLRIGAMKKSDWWIDTIDPSYATAIMKTYQFGAFFLKKRPSSSGQLQLEYIADPVALTGGNYCSTCSSGSMTASQSSDFSSGISVPVLYR